MGVGRRVSRGRRGRMRVGFKGGDAVDKAIKLFRNVDMASSEFGNCLLKAIKGLGTGRFSHGSMKAPVGMTRGQG